MCYTHTHTKHTVIDSVSIGCPGFALTANVAERQTDARAKRGEEKKQHTHTERKGGTGHEICTEPDNERVLKCTNVCGGGQR